MPLPSDFNTVRVYGKYTDFDGTATSGTISFITTTRLRSAVDKTIVSPGTIIIPLSVTGEFDTQIPATNDPDIVPVGWTYHVVERFSGQPAREYDLSLPLGADIDLTVASPAAPAVPAMYTYVKSVNDELPDADGNIEVAGIDPAAYYLKTESVAKGELTLNVKDYGAVGNGVTDDTTAINAALTAATSTGIKLVGLNKSHVVSGILIIPDGVHLTSLTGMSEIVVAAGFNFPVLRANGTTPHISHIKVRKAAGAVAGASGHGVHLIGISDGAVIEDVWVDGMSSGFYIGGHLGTVPGTATRTLLSRCRATNSNVYGFLLEEVNGTRLSECVSSVSGLDGVKLTRDAKNVTLTGGYFTGAVAGDGLDAYAGGDTLTIQGGTYSGNSINGITIKCDDLNKTDAATYGLVRKINVTGVHADNNTGNGITCHRSNGNPDDATEPLVRGFNLSSSSFQGNGSYGVYLQARMVTVSGVSCLRNGLDGVYLEPACLDVSLLGVNVAGNSVTAAGTRDGIHLDGTRIKVLGGSSIGADPDGATSDADVAAGTKTQRYGVHVAATATEVEVLGLSNVYNLTGDVQDLSGVLVDPHHGVRHLTSARYVVPDGTRSTLPMVATTEYAVPIWIGNSATIVRAGVEITVAGTAGTVIRLGLRKPLGFLPGPVVGSTATVVADAITTGIEATVSWPVTPGLYFLTATAQSTGGTLPTVRATTGNLAPISFGALASVLGAGALAGYLTAGTITGELPATFTISNRSAAPPLIAIRA